MISKYRLSTHVGDVLTVDGLDEIQDESDFVSASAALRVLEALVGLFALGFVLVGAFSLLTFVLPTLFGNAQVSEIGNIVSDTSVAIDDLVDADTTQGFVPVDVFTSVVAENEQVTIETSHLPGSAEISYKNAGTAFRVIIVLDAVVQYLAIGVALAAFLGILRHSSMGFPFSHRNVVGLRRIGSAFLFGWVAVIMFFGLRQLTRPAIGDLGEFVFEFRQSMFFETLFWSVIAFSLAEIFAYGCRLQQADAETV